MKRFACALALLPLLTLGAERGLELEMRYLDEMENVAEWNSLASDGVDASVRAEKGVDGNALVLEYNLNNTAGYAAATRKLPVTLPEDYEISFWMRGEAGRNHFEMKFVDASGDNVWWFRRANFQVTGDWQPIRIKRRQIEFAWGPTNDRTLKSFAGLEFVIAAGEDGGQGNLWFDRLAIKPVERPSQVAKPTLSATSEAQGHAAANAIDGQQRTRWQSDASGKDQILTLDLQAVQEFGGLEIDWAPKLHAQRYSIELSTDGKTWNKVRTVDAGNGGRDSHLLPESEARYIRVSMPQPGRAVGIGELHVRDLQFGASPNAFIESLARNARKGCYPRAYLNEQTYWTIIGVDGDSEESMLSEDGALEIRKGSFSIEPFIRVRDRWLTWADVSIQHSLAENYLPIPTVAWKHSDVMLSTTAYGLGEPGNARTEALYTVRNPTRSRRHYTLALAVRPFQVNPPAQFLNTPGGVSPIQDLAFENGVVHVDKVPSVFPKTPPQSFRAVTLAADTPCEWLSATDAPTKVTDESGFASGALLYTLDLAPGESRDIILDLPQHAGRDGARREGKRVEQQRQLAVSKQVAQTKAEVEQQWRDKLNRVELILPKADQALYDTLRTSLAHVLINRDGPAIQPGSRSYERSWIRDGAMTSEMLLRMGHAEVAKEFLAWYAPYQFANGKVPCCVDRRGADPVPENDSMGEFLFLIDEIYRYTGDEPLLRSMWPAVIKTVDYMDKLRLSERTPENQQGERAAFYGLMPASISHEGYSAKPMHSYWDNFWALGGYEASIRIARALNEKKQMAKFIESRDQFRTDLYRSLNTAMRAHKIDYLPGAAELGDFDATSTTIALTPVGETQMLPPNELNATFERYWKHFTARRTSTSWDAYTPYEWRNLGAFIRLGWRDRGEELIQFFMDDRRPAAWNQWGEVVGRVERESRFIGDMPHGWVASDYGRSLLDMFAFERQADETLVLMAGVPEAWTRKEGFEVRNLRTPFGPLSYSLKVEDDKTTLHVEPLQQMPVGGIAVSWPGEAPPEDHSIQRGFARWLGTDLRINELPFTIVFPR
ncbi:discoidin domain-containing protein [Steroidobacter sp. S1-65]|uniref:Discoidin domain-containing protein n=1 Tax=Steroidobacter gossypii TaxID=2805490 RepID=A0ABS1WXL8_9GAMM|nr:discoidin domain-containing protein [Steroidobacter gossypii]MBM0105729.1 discoidin domain-containing protein [Steroidobacter gossypii]